MTHTYQWNIDNLCRTTANGGVFEAMWSCYIFDAPHQEGMGGSITLNPVPDNNNFIPYEDLTEEVVLQWIYAQVDKDEVEQLLLNALQERITPTKTMGVPWVPGGVLSE